MTNILGLNICLTVPILIYLHVGTLRSVCKIKHTYLFHLGELPAAQSFVFSVLSCKLFSYTSQILLYLYSARNTVLYCLLMFDPNTFRLIFSANKTIFVTFSASTACSVKFTRARGAPLQVYCLWYTVTHL